MIELASVIGDLRDELERAIAAGKDKALRFELGPVELEVAIAIERGGQAGAKVRFWVVDLDADAKAGRTSSQRIKLVLQPRVKETGRAPYIGGLTDPDEK